MLAPESGEQGSDRQRNLSCLGPSQLDAGAEQELSTAPVLCHSGAALLLPDPSWLSPLCSSGRKKGQTPKPSARGVRPDSHVLPDNYSWFFFCFYFAASLSLDCLESQTSLSMLTDTKCFLIFCDASFGTECTNLSQSGRSSPCRFVTVL